MPETIVRGNTITLDGFYELGDGSATDPPDPRVSIIDPNGTVLLSLAVPTHVALGHFQLEYPVGAGALLGAWAARWFGTVDGFALTIDDGFTVTSTPAGSPVGHGGGVTCAPWATHEDAPAALQAYDIDPFDVDDAFQAATDVLYELTRRRFPGRCTDFIRPQAQWRAVEGPPRWWPSAMYWGFGSAYGYCSCHRGRETGCVRVPEVKLPGRWPDKTSIVVKIDGFQFDDWRLDDRGYLVRTDHDGWPCCQDLLLDDSQDRTFSIAYAYGRSPDTAGKRNAILLGTSIFADWFPDQAAGCKLPARATRVSRQGTTVDLGDPVKMVEAGLTGIRSVDLWVASKNLGIARRGAVVLIPGRHRSVRRTNT